MGLGRLAEAVSTCKACALGTSGHGVPGRWVDLALSAPGDEVVMGLGEAPGAVEMERSKPFVGQSGELLCSMLEEAGVKRIYLSNIVKHQPFKDKQGKQMEPDAIAIKACSPFLKQEFELIKPTKLILLGKTAAKLVVEGNFSMKDVVNTTLIYPPRPVRTKEGALIIRAPESSSIPTLILYHPAYFLRQRTAPWIVKQMSDWKRSVRMFMGDRPPTYQIERVRCEIHDN